ncbi:MAG: deoxyhypusine synthase [Methanomassiliicoccales archaeon]|nr:MAG: deoxyhypusine synthase [Methanomassiliicoccales archaeon]
MSEILGQKVEDINLSRNTSMDELVRQMYSSGGFTAKKVGIAANILENMIKDRDCVRFLSFPACIIATGSRGIIRDMVKQKMFDVIITTCGTLDHDIARANREYYHGSFYHDDAKLHQEGINRLGNILIPNESYGIVLEGIMQSVLKELWDSERKEWTVHELIWEFGKRMDNEESIIYWAQKNGIPILVPGITDGAFGSQLWMFYQEHRDFKIDVFKDEQILADIVFSSKKTGALMIGGGISKHHTIWWNQFKDGLDYVVYITTAQEFDGSLSGAKINEAISWGKVKEDAKHATVEGDATVILPLLFGAALGRL